MAELVGLREQQTHSQAPRLEPAQQRVVELREPAPDVDRHDQPDQRATRREIRSMSSRHRSCVSRRNPREAIARQVDEAAVVADREEIHELRASGRLADARELAHAREQIQRGRFAGVRAADERDLPARRPRGKSAGAAALLMKVGVGTSRTRARVRGRVLVYNRPPVFEPNQWESLSVNGHPTRAKSPLATVRRRTFDDGFRSRVRICRLCAGRRTRAEARPGPGHAAKGGAARLRRRGPREVGYLRRVPRRRRQQRDARLAEPRRSAPGVHRAPAQGLQDRRAQERHDETVRADALGPGRRRRCGLLRGAEADAEGRGPRARSASASRSIAAACRRAALRRASRVTALPGTATRSRPFRESAGSTPPTSRSRCRTTNPASGASDANQMMRNVASLLKDDEIRALASYVQGLD